MMVPHPLAFGPRQHRTLTHAPDRGVGPPTPRPPTARTAAGDDGGTDDANEALLEQVLDVDGDDGIRPITALALTLLAIAPLAALWGPGTAFGVVGGVLTLYQFFYRAANDDL